MMAQDLEARERAAQHQRTIIVMKITTLQVSLREPALEKATGQTDYMAGDQENQTLEPAADPLMDTCTVKE